MSIFQNDEYEGNIVYSYTIKIMNFVITEPESKLTMNSMRMREWIAAEITRAILEELPSLADQITNRLITRYEEQIANAQAVKRKNKETQERGPNSETQLGKRKRTQDPASLRRGEELNAAEPSVGGQKNPITCVNCGGTHKFMCHKLKCYNCGRKGHIKEDCTNERACLRCL